MNGDGDVDVDSISDGDCDMDEYRNGDENGVGDCVHLESYFR